MNNQIANQGKAVDDINLTPADVARQRASQTSGLTKEDAQRNRQKWIDQQQGMIFRNMIKDNRPHLPAEAFKGAIEMGNMLIGKNFDNLMVRGDTEAKWDALAFSRSIPFRDYVYKTARSIYGN